MKDFERHQLATELGLQFDPETSVIFGENSGYFFLIQETDKNVFRITISVSRDDEDYGASELQQLVSDSSVLKSIERNQYTTTYLVKTGMTKKKMSENIQQAVTDIAQLLQTKDFHNICGFTGQAGEVGLYQIDDSLFIMNEDSFQQVAAQQKLEADSYKSQKENVVMGIVGAFLGAILGGAVALVIARLGYVSYISGFVLGVCIVKGYELLGRKFTKKGALISVVFMLLAIVLVHQFDYAFEIVKQLGYDFTDAFALINEATLAGDVPENYFFNFFMLLGFTGIGAGVAISSAMSVQKTRGLVRKIA